jgi:hypothetical protein
MENNIVQPDIDHIKEPVMECGRPAWISLEQPTLGQELFQHRPRYRPIGDRGRVMRVKVSFMDPDGFDCFVVPPPKVVLNSNDRFSSRAGLFFLH